MTNLDSILKSRDHFSVKGPCSESSGFSSSHVGLWQLDHKEGWVLKNWCFCVVVLKKTLESPLDSKEIKLVHPKGNQSWIFIGRTDGEAEAPILWPPDVKSNSLENTLMLRKIEVRRRKGWQFVHELGQILGDGEGQGGLVCCSPWGCKESDMTESLNNKNNLCCILI